MSFEIIIHTPENANSPRNVSFEKEGVKEETDYTVVKINRAFVVNKLVDNKLVEVGKASTIKKCKDVISGDHNKDLSKEDEAPKEEKKTPAKSNANTGGTFYKLGGKEEVNKLTNSVSVKVFKDVKIVYVSKELSDKAYFNNAWFAKRNIEVNIDKKLGE